MRRTTAPKATKRTNPIAPMNAAVASPRLTGAPNSTTGSVKTGRASRPPTPRKEKAVKPPTVSLVSIPLRSSIRNCTAAPAAWPPGTMSEIALPASCAVITENQALVRSAILWIANVHAKWPASAKIAGMNQKRLSLWSSGAELRTAMTLGATR